jgi:hypothetical protein
VKEKNEKTETKVLTLFGKNYEKKFSFDKLKELLPKTTRREKLVHALMVLKRQKKIVEIEMDVYMLKQWEDELTTKPKTFIKTTKEKDIKEITTKKEPMDSRKR